MLIPRILTAMVLLPLLLAAVWWMPGPWLYLVFAVFGTVGAWEWGGLMGLSDAYRRLLYAAITAVLFVGVWYARDGVEWIAALGVLWWLLAIRLLLGFPDSVQRLMGHRGMLSLIGWLLLTPAVLSLWQLRDGEHGAVRLLYLFFLIFVADTGAYFSGRRYGKRKLAPTVSPGKTLEGLLGALACCAVWALTAGLWVFKPAGWDVLLLLLLSLLVAAVSVVGDLTESMFKRLAGVKDSGRLLPGHGGVLDRIDSLVAAAPLMVLGLQVTGL